jgi:hypothetical protein
VLSAAKRLDRETRRVLANDAVRASPPPTFEDDGVGTMTMAIALNPEKAACTDYPSKIE